MGNFVYATECPHCAVQKAAFSGWAILETPDPQESRIPLSCSHCHEIIVLTTTHSNGFRQWFYKAEPQINLNGLNSPVIILRTYPQSTVHRAPADVPERIAGVYVEALENLARGKYETCIFLCGKAMDLATKGMDPAWRIDTRLKKLAADGKITTEMADWAEEIRIDRNDAAHEDIEFNQTEAQEIVGFTEAFLNYVYTLPAMVHARRQECAEVEQ